MIKKIRVLLEYHTYCLWLYDEKDEIIDNNNPPEWNNDSELTNAFMSVSNLYDTFFVDNKRDFYYKGCPNEATAVKLRKLFSFAMQILISKNNGKYIIQNDVFLDSL